MATAKIIEVISEGSSIEEAIESGVNETAKSVKHIKGVYVKETQAVVEEGKVKVYRTTLKITFVIEKN